MAKSVRYTLTVYVDIPMEQDDTLDACASREAKRDIERRVIGALDYGLRKSFRGASADCEVMTVEQIGE